jgi:diguanylate cyclase (GGDEF)-like protein
MNKRPPQQQNPDLSHAKLQIMSELLGAVISISSQREITEITREASKQITQLLKVDSCAISNWDREENTVSLWAEVAIHPEKVLDEWLLPYSLDDYPLTRFVLENGKAAQVRMDDPEGDKAERELLKDLGVTTLLMLPLVTEGKVIGLAEIMDYKNSRIFSNEEIALAYLLLNQVSVLIERAQILDEAKRRADELEALRQASFSLTTSEELDAVLKEVLKSTISLFPDTAGAYIYMFANGILTYESATLPNGEGPGAWADPHSNGLVISVANSGNMMIIGDITEHPLFENFPENNTGAVIGLPLKTGERVVGVMVIRFKPRKFTEDVMRILQLLGDQAAVAIERARSMFEIRRRVFELEALRQTSLTLTSTLDIKEVLQAILKSVLYLSDDAMDAHLFLYENNRLSFGAALWADGAKREPFALPREDGLTYRVAREGEVIVVQNMHEDPLFAEKVKEDPELWRGAIVGLPLISGEEVVGVMNVAYQTPRGFDRDTLRVLGLLADQATLAITNAKLHQSISKQAQTDALTGLANRRAFNQYLEEEIKRSIRYKRTFSIIMMDLDGFKRVNDTYGHLEGDNVLIEVAECLRNACRETDLTARWGGDEFITLLPETTLKNAQAVAEKIINVIGTHRFELTNNNHQSVSLSITAGVVNFPTHGETARELIYSADNLLYEGKAKNANSR